MGIAEFVAKCPNCQQVKAGKLNAEWFNSSDGCPYLKVGRYQYGLYSGLSSNLEAYSIWVIVDRLMKSACFIPIKSTIWRVICLVVP